MGGRKDRGRYKCGSVIEEAERGGGEAGRRKEDGVRVSSDVMSMRAEGGRRTTEVEGRESAEGDKRLRARVEQPGIDGGEGIRRWEEQGAAAYAGTQCVVQRR